MMVSNLRRLLGVVAVPLFATACTSSLELDRFRVGEASSVDSSSAIAINYFDVRFSAKGMTSHIGEYFEVRVVDRENRIQAKAIYTDVTGPDFTLYLGRVVPKTNAPYRLDFWADHNSTAKYDGIEGGINEKDHAWRRVMADPLPEDMRLVQGRYELQFVHDTNFVDIGTDLQGNKITVPETLLPYSLKITGAAEFVGKTIEQRVVDKASTRLLGLHRQGRIKEEYTAKIAGILDEQTAYEVSVYVDANENGKYDPEDPSWKVDLSSDSSGLTGELNLATAPRGPIETGEP
jgi:hypothetical protein